MDALDAQTPMMQLTSDLLHIIWRELEHQENSNADQLAWRCTCRAMRDASTPWITSLQVQLHLDANTSSSASRWDVLGQHFATQLSLFPSAATIRQLVILRDDAAGSGPMHDLVAHVVTDCGMRLAGLQQLILHRLDLSSGDVYDLATACPGLQRLTVDSGRLSGNSFAGLRRLASLRSVSLLGSTAIHGTATLLRHLPATLTSLKIQNLQAQWGAVSKPRGVPLNCVLPYLAHIAELRSLTVQLDSYMDNAAETEPLDCIAHLRHLTHIEIAGCPSVGLAPGCHLACTSCLVSLALPAVSLDTVMLQAAFAMPRLEALFAWTLLPEADLSSQPCHGAAIFVEEISPKHLARLPQRMEHDISVMAAEQCWTLSSSSSLCTVCQQVRLAATLLATGWAVAPEDMQLRIAWDAPAPYDTAPVLGELAPLGERLGSTLSLSLTSNWVLSQAHGQQLAQAMPHLNSLVLQDASEQHMAQMVAGLAPASVPAKLELLSNWSSLPDAVYRELREALLSMACGRVVAGHSISIWHSWLFLPPECERINAELEVAAQAMHKDTAGQKQCLVKFMDITSEM